MLLILFYRKKGFVLRFLALVLTFGAWVLLAVLDPSIFKTMESTILVTVMKHDPALFGTNILCTNIFLWPFFVFIFLVAAFYFLSITEVILFFKNISFLINFVFHFHCVYFLSFNFIFLLFGNKYFIPIKLKFIIFQLLILITVLKIKW